MEQVSNIYVCLKELVMDAEDWDLLAGNTAKKVKTAVTVQLSVLDDSKEWLQVL